MHKDNPSGYDLKTAKEEVLALLSSRHDAEKRKKMGHVYLTDRKANRLATTY